jgi:hypothetical protein
MRTIPVAFLRRASAFKQYARWRRFNVLHTWMTPCARFNRMRSVDLRAFASRACAVNRRLSNSQPWAPRHLTPAILVQLTAASILIFARVTHSRGQCNLQLTPAILVQLTAASILIFARVTRT